MSATERFHHTANDCLERIAADLWPGAKLALVIYTQDKPELDIVLKDSGLNVDEVVSTLRRRGGLMARTSTSGCSVTSSSAPWPSANRTAIHRRKAIGAKSSGISDAPRVHCRKN